MTIEAYVLELGQEPQLSYLAHDPVYEAQHMQNNVDRY
jgi:hypothetical protein